VFVTKSMTFIRTYKVTVFYILIFACLDSRCKDKIF
jgi:hypothetical protein